MVIAELVDGCNLKCELCWNRERTGSFQQMSLGTVAKIVRKYRKSHIDWFNWGEPLLHTEFTEVAKLVSETDSRISTNLSIALTPELLKALRSFTRVTVSISGVTQTTYSLYHHGGELLRVFRNLGALSQAHKGVVLKWLEHPKNEHERPEAERMSKNLGIPFTSTKLNCLVEEWDAGFTHEFLTPPEFFVYSKGRSCRLLKWLPIGVDGSYLLCCASKNIPVGYTLDDNPTQEELAEARMNQPLCQSCREHGHWRKMF